jgi:hypothetical protein
MIKIYFKRIVKIIIVALVIITAIALIALSSSYTVLIKAKDTGYFYARDILLVGDFLFCLRDSIEYTSIKEAENAEPDDYDFTFLSMKNITSIEKISDNETVNAEITENKNPGKDVNVAKSYLGVYRIDVSGNSGFLYLSKNSKNGKIYGSVKFPEWAHGVFEPLKNLWIKNDKLGFIRSIETLEEKNRVGAPNFFTQEFYGEYKEEGNSIEGYFIYKGAKMMWRGYKVKRK